VRKRPLLSRVEHVHAAQRAIGVIVTDCFPAAPAHAMSAQNQGEGLVFLLEANGALEVSSSRCVVRVFVLGRRVLVGAPAKTAWLCVCVCVNMCSDVLEPLSLRTSSYASSGTSAFSLLLMPSIFFVSARTNKRHHHHNLFRLLRQSTSTSHPIPRAHFLHLPTSPRFSLCTSTMTT
jgi:hypothetical protein